MNQKYSACRIPVATMQVQPAGLTVCWGQKYRNIGKYPMTEIKRNHQIKAIFFLLFLAKKFQPAWKNAATSTIIRARPLIKIAPDDLPPNELNSR
jgi:hypothetical protein